MWTLRSNDKLIDMCNLKKLQSYSISHQRKAKTMKTADSQGWKPGCLALGCQFQFRCVETQMSGFSLGLVSWLLENRFQFRFQFWLCTTSVSGFQFRFKFYPRKLFYFEYGLRKGSISWRFCFITMISSSTDDRVSRAIASEVVSLVLIPSPVKPKTQKLVFTPSLFDPQH